MHLHIVEFQSFATMLKVWSTFILIMAGTSIAASTSPDAVILAPTEGASFVLANKQTVSVEVEYAIRNVDISKHISFCFDVTEMTQGTANYPESCFTAERLRVALTEVAVGEYLITSYLKDENDTRVLGSISHVKFSVKSFEKALPIIQLFSSPFYFLEDRANIADLPLRYTLGSSILDGKDFLVCMWVTSDSATNVMDKVCVPSSQTDIVLKGVTQGVYTFFAALQSVGASNLIECSVVSTKIQVMALHEAPLALALVGHSSVQEGDRYNLEFAVDSADPIKLNLATEGPQAAAEKTVICLVVHSNLSADQELPVLSAFTRDNCYPAHTDEFSIPRSAPGLYAISFYLLPAPASAATGDPQTSTEAPLRPVARVLRVRVEVRNQQEFVPSYDWRPLRPWHSVPAGIETRLPVGTRGGAIKEARIPQPWRLQLPLPAPPCRYFLRMDLSRRSTVRDIMAQASAQCKQPASCFLVYADDSLLGSEVTVEDCNFFQRTQKIEFDPSCLV